MCHFIQLCFIQHLFEFTAYICRPDARKQNLSSQFHLIRLFFLWHENHLTWSRSKLWQYWASLFCSAMCRLSAPPTSTSARRLTAVLFLSLKPYKQYVKQDSRRSIMKLSHDLQKVNTSYTAVDHFQQEYFVFSAVASTSHHFYCVWRNFFIAVSHTWIMCRPLYAPYVLETLYYPCIFFIILMFSQL